MKIDFTIKKEAAANKYLKLIHEDNEILFEEISTQYSNEELQSMLKHFKYKYKGKLMTYQDVCNKVVKTSDQLKFPKIHKDLLVPNEAKLFIIDRDVFASTYKAISFEETLGRARYNLIKAVDLFFIPIEVEWSKGYGAHYKLRAIYLENAIIDYNQCFDFILQMWWFAFGFYKLSEKYDAYLNFRKLSSICTQNEMGRIIKEHIEDPTQKQYWKKLNAFSGKLDKINSWANEIKHRGNLRIEGVYIEELYEIKIFNEGTVESTKDYTPIVVNLEDAIRELEKVHKTYVDCYEFSVEAINYRKAISIYERIFRTTNEHRSVPKENFMPLILK